MVINENWTFKQLVYDYIKKMRHEYDRGLCLFKCYEVKEKTQYIKECREKIFNLKIEYWQKERIWEYLNHDEIYAVLKDIASKYR